MAHLKSELQTELHPAHGRLNGSDLAIARAIRRNLIRAGEADAARVAKPWRVRGVERFPAELHVVPLAEREVLEHGKVDVPLAGTTKLIVPGAAEVAEIRTGRDLTRYALISLGIKP